MHMYEISMYAWYHMKYARENWEYKIREAGVAQLLWVQGAINKYDAWWVQIHKNEWHDIICIGAVWL